MKKWIIPILILLFLILTGKVMSPLFVIAIRNTNISTDQWREDVLYLKKELASKHINIYFNISEGEYNEAFDKLLEDIPGLKSDEIVIRLLENISLIRDSHTNLLNFQIGTDLIYPVELYRFKDGYYVVNADEENKDLIGSKLIAINDINIESVEESISKIIPHENKYWMYRNMPSYISDPRVLQYFNVISDYKSNFSFIGYDGKLYKVDLQAKKENDIQFVQIDKSESEIDLASDEYRLFEKEKTLYMNVFENKQLSYDINAILNKEQNKNVENLIIDLRNHSGGSFAPYSKLVTSIKNNDKINKKGHIFIIIGRNTFSSGLLLALDLKKNTNAIFYGEPTGGRPEHYGDIRNIKLPNSKIVVTYSTKHFNSDNYKTDSLYPDIKVDLTINDMLNGVDPVIKEILGSYDT